jgi:hypothetical protein
MAMIAKQLHNLMTHGLLDDQRNGRPLAIAPPRSDRAMVFPQVS